MTTVELPDDRVHAGSLVLINREHRYMANGQEALVPVQEHLPSIKMQRGAATCLATLMADIRGWVSIVLVSGWRSFQEQQKIWDDTLAEKGLEFTRKYVAPPGHSEHHTGLAIDLGLKRKPLDLVRPDFPYSGICQAFRHRAAEYGFIERYPAGKEHVTGIAHEPWHFRYVGAPHAEIMVKNGLTLEEYTAFIKQFPYGRKAYGTLPRGQVVLVSYLKAEQRSTTRLEIDGSAAHDISGNNLDGFIITEWRQPNAPKTELRGASPIRSGTSKETVFPVWQGMD